MGARRGGDVIQFYTFFFPLFFFPSIVMVKAIRLMDGRVYNIIQNSIQSLFPCFPGLIRKAGVV